METESVTYLSVKSTATRYDVSVPTIWRWVSQGRFPAPIKLGENTTRWRLADLLEWEKEAA